MLARSARLHRKHDFDATVRTGRRAARPLLVVHLASSLTGPSGSTTGENRATAVGENVKVGFVVSKSVGNSVTRHRVTRQLRHVVAPLVADLPTGTRMVVRALPAAASASSAALAADLDAALRKMGLTADTDL